MSYSYNSSKKRRRGYRLPSMAETQAWGASYGDSPGRTAALVELFETMVNRRWENQDFRRQQRAYERDFVRDTQRDLTQHQQSMERTAYTDFIRDGNSPWEWSDYSSGLFGNSMPRSTSDSPGTFNKDGGNIFASIFGSDTKVAQAFDRGANPTPTNQFAGQVSKVKELVSNFFGDDPNESAYTPEDKGLLSSAIEWAVDNTPGGKALEAIGLTKPLELAGKSLDQGEDNLWWALDKLSRPLYGVTEAVDTWYEKDTDNTSGNSVVDLLSGAWQGTGFLLGEPIGTPLNDVNFSDVGDVFKSFGKGMANGGFTGNASDPVLTADIIRSNTEDDGKDNFYDNEWYQGLVGFTGDVIFDPLSYVGVGLAKKAVSPLKSRLAQREWEASDAAIKSLAEELASKNLGDAGFVRESLGDTPSLFDYGRPLNSDEIYKMLGGGLKYAPSAGLKSEYARRTYENVNVLTDLLNKGSITADTAPREAIRSLAEGLASRRAAVLDEFQGSSFLNDLQRAVGIDEANGKPVLLSADEINETLTTQRLVSVMPELRAYNASLDKTAEALNYGSNFTNGRKQRPYESYLNDLNLKDEAGRSELASRFDAILNEKGKGSPLSKLVPELAQDYRFTADEIDDLFRTSYVASTKVQVWKDVARRTDGLRNDLRDLHAKKRNFANKGIDTTEVERQIAAKQNLLESEDIRKDMVQADIMIKLLKSKLASKQGMTTFKDVARAKEIDFELKDIQKRIKQAEEGPNNAHIGTTGKPEEFMDDLSELKAMEKELRTELKSLKGIPAAEKRNLSNVPETLLNKNGEPDIGKIRHYVNFDYKTEQFVFKSTGDEATDAWLKSVKKVLEEKFGNKYYTLKDNAERPIREAEAKAAAKSKAERDYEDLKDATAGKSNKGKSTVTPKDWKARSVAAREAKQKAVNATYDELALDIKMGRLSESDYSNSLLLKSMDPSDPEKLMEALRWKRGDKLAEEWYQANLAKQGAPAKEIARIDAHLRELKQLEKKAIAQEKKAIEEAKLARKELEKRMREEALLKIVGKKVANQQTKLSLLTWGTHELFTIPGSQAMFAAVEKASGLPLLKQARQTWANAFKSPIDSLNDDFLKLQRARALSAAPSIIETHIKHLRKTFEQFETSAREASFKAWRKGNVAPVGDNAIHEAINSAFEDLMPYFTRQYKVGGEVLTVEDINRFLPAGMKVNGSRDPRNPRELISRLGGAARDASKAEKVLSDPLGTSWVMRVAVENAVARKALEHNIKSMFGIRRGVNFAPDGRKLGKLLDDESIETIEQFRKLGWDVSPKMNDQNYLFPPEIIPDINRLMDMMDPVEIGRIGKLIDEATGIWKQSVTLYNPGYYSRNGIGEAMSSWFAGLNDPMWYKRSMKLIRYARHDSKEVEEVVRRFPGMGKRMGLKTSEQQGKEVAFSLNGGKQVTYADVWKLAQDTGVKTNFFNTEFLAQYNKAGTAIRSNSVGRAASKVHDTVRSAGEWTEDYWRMAHFMFAMKKSGAKTLDGAAAYAAKEVRKYHFDYTDFTDFEKAKMLRAFPFYKWTRKALPLMVSMLFQKPGKVMAYNKAMHNISETVTHDDIAGEDTNGFMPNYRGQVPSFIQDMWAYSIGTDVEGNQTFFNMATPQMDSFKAGTNPVNTAYALSNPLFKIPAEELMGRSLNPGYTSYSGDLNGRLTADEESLSNLANINPLSKILRQIIQNNSEGKDSSLTEPSESGTVMDEQLLSFLTGLGFYEDRMK